MAADDDVVIHVGAEVDIASVQAALNQLEKITRNLVQDLNKVFDRFDVAKNLGKEFDKAGRVVQSELDVINDSVKKMSKRTRGHLDDMGDAVKVEFVKPLQKAGNATEAEAREIINAFKELDKRISASTDKTSDDVIEDFRAINKAITTTIAANKDLSRETQEALKIIGINTRNHLREIEQERTQHNREINRDANEASRIRIQQNEAALRRENAVERDALARRRNFRKQFWETLASITRAGVRSTLTIVTSWLKRSVDTVRRGMNEENRVIENEMREGNRLTEQGLERRGRIIRSEGKKNAKIAKRNATLAASASGGLLGAATGRSAVGGGLRNLAFLGGGAFGISALASLGGEFQAVVRQLAVFNEVTEETDVRMQALSEQFIKIGGDIALPGVSAKDAADAFFFLQQSGVKLSIELDEVENSAQIARNALLLSRSAAIEVGEAANITASLVNVFNLEAEDLAGTVDALNGAFLTGGAATINDFGLALQRGGGFFSQYQLGAVSAEQATKDFLAAVALLGQQGIVGGTAGTGIQRVLRELTDPRNAQAETLLNNIAAGVGRTNLAFDETGSAIGFNQVIKDIRESFEGLSQQEITEQINTIFGGDAAKAAIPLLTATAEAWDDVAESINREGLAADLAKAQNSGLKGAMDALASVAETAFLTFFQLVDVPIGNAIVLIASAVETLLFNNGAGWTALRRGILGAVAALTLFATVLLGMQIIPFVVAGLIAMVSPIGLLIVGVAALGAAFAILFNSVQPFHDAIVLAGQAVGNFVGFLFGGLVDGLSAASRAVVNFGNTVVDNLPNLGGGVADLVTQGSGGDLASTLGDIFGGGEAVFAGILGPIEDFQNAAEPIVRELQSDFANFGRGVASLFTGGETAGLADAIDDIFGDTGAIIAPIERFLDKGVEIVRRIIAFGESFVNAFREAVIEPWDNEASLFDNISTAIINGFNLVATTLVEDVWPVLRDGFLDLFDTVSTWVTDSALPTIGQAFTDLFDLLPERFILPGILGAITAVAVGIAALVAGPWIAAAVAIVGALITALAAAWPELTEWLSGEGGGIVLGALADFGEFLGGDVMSAIFSEAGLTIAAAIIGGIAVGLLAFASGFLDGLLSDAIPTLVASLDKFLGDLLDAIDASVENVPFLGPIVDYITDTVETWFSGVGDILTGMSEFFGGFFGIITNLLRGDIEGANEAARQAMAGLGTAMVGSLKQALAPLLPALTRIFDLLPEPIQDFLTTVTGQLGEIGTAVADFLGHLTFEDVGEGISTAVTSVRDAIGGVAAEISGFFRGIFGGRIVHLAEAVFGNLRTAMNGFLDYWRGVWDVIAGIFTLDPGRVMEGLSGMVAGTRQILSGFLQNLGVFITNIPQLFASAVGAILEGIQFLIVEGMSAMVGFITRNISGLFDALKDALGSGFIGGVLNPFIDAIQGVFVAFGGIFQNVIQIIDGVIDVILGLFKLDFKQVFNGLGKIGGGILKAFGNVIVALGKIVVAIPRAILSLIINAAKAIYKAIPKIIKRIVKEWVLLPVTIGKAIAGGALWLWNEVFLPAADWVLAQIPLFFDAIIFLFVGFPTMIGQAFAGAASWLWDSVLQPAFDWVMDLLGESIQFMVDAFLEFPQNLVDVLGDLGGFIWDAVFQPMWDFFKVEIPAGIEANVEFFSELPGKIVDALGDLGGFIWDAVSSGFGTLVENIGGIATDMLQFFIDLPGLMLEQSQALIDAGLALGGDLLQGIIDGISAVIGLAADIGTTLASAIGSALESAWNTVVDVIADAADSLPSFNTVFGSIDPGSWLSDQVKKLKFAHGGIVTGPVNAIIGEAGPEVVIPLSENKKDRAAELLRRSGLDKMATASEPAPTVWIENLNVESNADDPEAVGMALASQVARIAQEQRY